MMPGVEYFFGGNLKTNLIAGISLELDLKKPALSY
jgi:hypothetical protein